MAASFAVNVYGTVNEQPPFVADVNGNLPSINATYASPQLASFPVGDTNVWAIQPGAKMNGVFCYGVIEVTQGPLTQLYTQKFVVKETVAVLASLRG